MLAGISSLGNSYYGSSYVYAPAVRRTAGSGLVRAASIPAAQPEAPVGPVQPVRPVPETSSDTPLDRSDLLRRLAADPAAARVRGQIQYVGAGARDRAEKAREELEPYDLKSAQEAAEEGECQTCKRRKYQDGSGDPGVSFKTAAHVDPDLAQSVIRGHENEHVARNQAKADREGRKVVSQWVAYHTAICPECGRAYVSGGTTRTVTADEAEQPAAGEEKEGAPGGAPAAA